MYRGALSVWGCVVWSPTVQSRATFGGHDDDYDDRDDNDDVRMDVLWSLNVRARTTFGYSDKNSGD